MKSNLSPPKQCSYCSKWELECTYSERKIPGPLKKFESDTFYDGITNEGLKCLKTTNSTTTTTDFALREGFIMKELNRKSTVHSASGEALTVEGFISVSSSRPKMPMNPHRPIATKSASSNFATTLSASTVSASVSVKSFSADACSQYLLPRPPSAMSSHIPPFSIDSLDYCPVLNAENLPTRYFTSASEEFRFMNLYASKFISAYPIAGKAALDDGMVHASLLHAKPDVYRQKAPMVALAWCACSIGASLSKDSRALEYLELARNAIRLVFDMPSYALVTALFAMEITTNLAKLAIEQGVAHHSPPSPSSISSASSSTMGIKSPHANQIWEISPGVYAMFGETILSSLPPSCRTPTDSDEVLHKLISLAKTMCSQAPRSTSVKVNVLGKSAETSTQTEVIVLGSQYQSVITSIQPSQQQQKYEGSMRGSNDSETTIREDDEYDTSWLEIIEGHFSDSSGCQA